MLSSLFGLILSPSMLLIKYSFSASLSSHFADDLGIKLFDFLHIPPQVFNKNPRKIQAHSKAQ